MTNEWIWIATEVDEDIMPVWAETVHDGSGISSSDFNYDPASDAEIFPPPSQWTDKAVFRIKRFMMKRVLALSCIPTTSSSPLVDEKLIAVIQKYVTSDEVFFYPATVQTSDGETQKYSLVIPLIAKECIDLSQCEGVGRMPDVHPDLVWGYRTAKHYDNCLAGMHMVRDLVYPGNIVVSHKLKTALEHTGDIGLAFHKVEEIREVGYYKD